MKKSYFKSLGFILLGVLLATSIFSFSSEKIKIRKSNLEVQQTNSLVNIDTAKQQIAAHQMWLKMMPDTIAFNPNTNTITYPQAKPITPDDATVLLSYYERFKELRGASAENVTLDNIPFNRMISYSYYISEDDIKDAFDHDNGANGINVYLAMKGFVSGKLDSMTSHLYVVPTQRTISSNNGEKDSILMDKLIKGESVLDLTDPCPNLCAKNTSLYEPTLKPYGQQ